MNLKHKGYDEKTKERLVFGQNVFIVYKAQTQVSGVVANQNCVLASQNGVLVSQRGIPAGKNCGLAG